MDVFRHLRRHRRGLTPTTPPLGAPTSGSAREPEPDSTRPSTHQATTKPLGHNLGEPDPSSPAQLPRQPEAPRQPEVPRQPEAPQQTELTYPTLDCESEPPGAPDAEPSPPPILVLTRTSVEGRSREHLRTVCAGLDAAGIDYWYVPSPNTPTRTRLATRVAAPQVLAAVAPELDQFWTASRWDSQNRDWAPISLTDPDKFPLLPESDVLCFYATVKDPNGRRRIGISASTEVETWRLEGPDLVAPRGHVRGRSIPAADPMRELTLRDRHLRSYQALLEPDPSVMIDPIDAVITWVDSSDPDYLARRRRWLDDAEHVSVLASGQARTRGLDELRYLLRSIDMYAPWLRHVYLVTDGQTPPWLDTDRDDISVVDHREIFDPQYADTTLPTFNSHAIEANLHRIPGLTEHYVYFNDDTMLASRTVPETFFEGSGRILFQPSGELIGAGPATTDEAAPGWAGRNVRTLLERDFGRTITRKLRHVPHPQRREIASEVAERYRDQWLPTTAHRWRDNTDIAPIQLHLWYAMLTGRASAAKVNYRYVELSEITQATQLTRMASALKQTDMFCLNLRTEPKLAWEELEDGVKSLLTSLYPFQSRFELETESAAAELAKPEPPLDAAATPPKVPGSARKSAGQAS